MNLLYRHPAFCIPDGDSVIVFLPTLFRVLRVERKTADSISGFILDKKPLPISRWVGLPDYTFLGTNLILTNQCNLHCIYCSTDCGPAKDVVLGLEVAQAAIDYVVSCALRNNRSLVYANFFGGEPTRAWNVLTDAAVYMRATARKNALRSRLTITTNGVFLPWQGAWLAENIDGIMISLDGFKEIHDFHRDGSFDRVFARAKEMYRVAPRKLRFRTTISSYSADVLPAIVEFIGENFPGCVQVYEPLFGIGRGKSAPVQAPDDDLFFNKFIEALPIARRYNARLKTSVLGLGTRDSRNFCGVAGMNFMITPDGRVVSCNRMAEEGLNEACSSFFFGRYNSTKNVFIFDPEAYQRLKAFHVESIDTCRECFARTCCKGDCVANKAVIDPAAFWKARSYRCEATKRFLINILRYLLNEGRANGLLI
ncbi:MAG: SPASM domain-containing protein [bacterium]|nr:SPASM domain-containing protein [bacterium]